MKMNPITTILLILFLYPILRGFIYKFSSVRLKNDIQGIESNIVFVAALFIGGYFTKQIFLMHETGIYKRIYTMLPRQLLSYIEGNPIIIYLIIMPILTFIIYESILLLFSMLNYLLIYPLLDSLESASTDWNSFTKRVTGAGFQLPRSICYVLFAALLFNIASIFHFNPSLNKYLENSFVYKEICKQAIIPITNSKLARKLPSILDNSFKMVVKQADSVDPKQTQNNRKVIIYYNGVTLDEGVTSSKAIDDFARHLVAQEGNSELKAKEIYTWIGENVSYDYDKASQVLNNNFSVASGAIPAFQTRKGICFDYSCLFVAMCRANGMRVRLVTGEGFNGVGWISHAWNQVYIPERDKWINVDTTFYKGGNYFNSKRFDFDHKNASIAGEW